MKVNSQLFKLGSKNILWCCVCMCVCMRTHVKLSISPPKILTSITVLTLILFKNFAYIFSTISIRFHTENKASFSLYSGMSKATQIIITVIVRLL